MAQANQWSNIFNSPPCFTLTQYRSSSWSEIWRLPLKNSSISGRPCPGIRSGVERPVRIHREKQPLSVCHFRCNGVNCNYGDKRCWYCEVVEVTILSFLIPVDEGHHRAVCSIPDSKERLQESINGVSRELEAAKDQTDNAAVGVSQSPTNVCT